MAFFSVERNGYLTVSSLIADIVKDMANNGFAVKFPASYISPAAGAVPDTFKVILEAPDSVDPLADSQAWQICFDVLSNQRAAAYVATDYQFDDVTGTVRQVTSPSGDAIDTCGAVGDVVVNANPNVDSPSEGFLNRQKRIGLNASTYPMTYRLTITDRGLFVGVWEGSWSTLLANTSTSANYFNWILVQRPVDRFTGDILVTGRCPVFCVNQVNYKYWKFVVREADILHPTRRVRADDNTEDSHMIFNVVNQVALTEDKKYLLTFPHNLTTPRFRYTEELDIIGITSSDVVMASSMVEFSTYGESRPRQYVALPPSGANNTGARICVLTRPSVTGSGATFSVTTSNGTITGVTVVNGGSGYDAVPNVAFIDSKGNGATATCTVVNGAINSVTVTSPGTDYTASVAVKLK